MKEATTTIRDIENGKVSYMVDMATNQQIRLHKSMNAKAKEPIFVGNKDIEITIERSLGGVYNIRVVDCGRTMLRTRVTGMVLYQMAKRGKLYLV